MGTMSILVDQPDDSCDRQTDKQTDEVDYGEALKGMDFIEEAVDRFVTISVWNDA